MPDIQKNKICRVFSDNSDFHFLVRTLRGVEGISQLFRFEAQLTTKDMEVDFKKIIGLPMVFEIDPMGDGDPRFVHGIVSRFRQVDNPDIPLEEEQTSALYWAEIVPWTWLLTRRQDCRIFQNKNVPDIVQEVIDNLGFTDYELRLSGTHEPLVNCVQYQETDFAFISRLLESTGIYYFFEHDANGHKMVLADSPKENNFLPGYEQAFYTTGSQTEGFEYRVHSWKVEEVLQPGKHALSDFNFRDPATDLLVESANTLDQHGADKFEIFHYPGCSVNLGGEDEAKLAKGEAVVKLLREQKDTAAVVASGRSNCRAFLPGSIFTLEGHPRQDFNTDWLLTGVSHDLDQRAALGQNLGDPVKYSNQITCIKHEVPYRPARVTPKPRVPGAQTAKVVGPSGEEIYVDKYGRVKVQFPWDRYGQEDENSSCWVRVAQNWAGKQWGILFHPRIGQEVVVEFLDGDPDRPLITGRVYNGAQPIPFDGPTQSGILTRSTKEGSADTFNQIRFEDQKDSEEIYIHAEKDMKRVVENNDNQSVEGGQNISVAKSKVVDVGTDQQEKVGENMTLSVGADRAMNVGGACTESVGKNMDLSISGKYSESVGESRTVSAGKANSLSVGEADSTSVGKDQSISVGQSRSISVGKNFSIKVDGGSTYETKDGWVLKAKKIAIEAKDELQIKVGKAQIILKKNGDINLKGKKIDVKGSGDIILKGKKVAQN